MTLLTELLTALWLGILTSISPCPLATNVAAITFISKKFDSKAAVLLNGILYTFGRMLTYALLGFLIIKGMFSVPSLSALLQGHIAKLLGPAMVLTGMFLLDLLWLPKFRRSCGCDKNAPLKDGHTGSFLMGSFFALAFCPASAAIFFGALIPLALDKHSILGMPLLYGLGTGVPVVVLSILVAAGFSGIRRYLQNIARLELWTRRLTGVLFILIGLYYILTHIFGMI